MAPHEPCRTGSGCPNSPFVQFHLTNGVDVREERLQGLRMRLEEVEERHGAEGLGGRPDLVPRPLQDRLLFRSQHFLERVAHVFLHLPYRFFGLLLVTRHGWALTGTLGNLEVCYLCYAAPFPVPDCKLVLY